MATAPRLIEEEVLSLAKRVAALSGETERDAVIISLKERLERLEDWRRRRASLDELRAQWRSLPKVEPDLTADGLYGERGLPK
ncbi:MAG: type II toxin-antitoxin system VapB family antitoxin [Myxococcota bacterium]